VKEQTFFEEGYVKVTRSRIVVANQTYPVANITSIRTDIDLPSRKGPVLLGIVGTILMLASFNGSLSAFVIGASLLALAAYICRQAKPTYTIFFGTARGDRRALQSEDGEYVFRVAEAIDEALRLCP